MSKELDRLEHLRLGIQYIDQDKSPAFVSQYEEDINIIERALKRLNYIDENKIYCASENYLQDIKKLKALEIIKKKRVDVQLLKDSKNLNDYNWCVHTKNRSLTEEEYEFLKEIFDNE